MRLKSASLQKMYVPVEIKSVSDKGLVEGYASVFGNVDLGGDVISKDAPFKEYVKNAEGKVLHLFQHDSAGYTPSAGLPIGLAEVEQNSKGLKFASQLVLDDPFVKERVLPHFKARTLTGMSIGYDVMPGGAKVLESGVRELNALKLWEISSVTFGMNPKASMDSVKGLTHVKTIRELEDQLRDVVGLSRAEAKRHASAIWSTLSTERDARGNADDNAATIDSMTSFLKGVKA